MEGTNRNIEIISLIKKWMEEGIEGGMKDYIKEFSYKEAEKNALYVKCVEELKKIEYLQGLEYRKTAMDICNYYLELSNGKRFNQVTYNNEYRKKHYKQLNIDIPIEKMEEFEKKLSQNHQTKKEIVLEWIDEYINNEK